MSSFLITGGAGFIGSNIALRLIKAGHEVTILDNFYTGLSQNISGIRKNVKLIKGDIRNFKKVEHAARDVDYVLHQAALLSVQRSFEELKNTNDINIGGTLNVLLAARKNNVKRVIYASSCAVYGNASTVPQREDAIPNPISPYAVSKLVSEFYCRLFYKLYGLETVCLRYFNVFGPRQNPNSRYAAVIPKFATLMLEDKRPIIFGDGKQTRDFIFVDDVVEANMLATKARHAAGEVFNIANGQQISINQLVALLNDVLGTNIKPTYAKPRAGDTKHSLADISKARKILGFKPKYNFEYGLRKTVAWFAQHHRK